MSGNGFGQTGVADDNGTDKNTKLLGDILQNNLEHMTEACHNREGSCPSRKAFFNLLSWTLGGTEPEFSLCKETPRFCTRGHRVL